MRALQCDRCGRFYISTDSGDRQNKLTSCHYDYQNEVASSVRIYDLCPKCSEEFEEWVSKQVD